MEGSASNSLSADSAIGEGSPVVPVIPPNDPISRNPAADRPPPDASGDKPSSRSDSGSSSASSEPPKPTIQYADFEEGVAHLPPYARSLLKIKVPVSVMLAESQQTIDTIMNIGPGSILHFSKSCEDTLALEVAGQKIAVGETVKIGDKFGLWITAIILPDERFWVIGRSPKTMRAK